MRTLIDQRLRRRLLILASMALGAVGVSAPRASAQTGTIVGRVTDARFGSGRAERRHSDRGHTIHDRNECGRPVSCHSVPVGSHTLTARRIGYSVDDDRRRRGYRDVTADFALQAGAVCARSSGRHRNGWRAGASLRRQRRDYRQRAQKLWRKRSRPTSAASQGWRAGVTVLDRSGRLGSGPTIQIRGRTASDSTTARSSSSMAFASITRRDRSVARRAALAVRALRRGPTQRHPAGRHRDYSDHQGSRGCHDLW